MCGRNLKMDSRSDHYWEGLFSDLVIEQVLKTNGGLTQCCGMSACSVWCGSCQCQHVLMSTEQRWEVTSINYHIRDQHKDLAKPRQEYDQQETKKLLHFLIDRSPFGADSSLYSIITAVTAHTIIGDKAKEVVYFVLKSMVSKNALDIFKCKAQAVTFATDKGVVIDGKTVHVYPQILFQRLVYVKAQV